MTKIVLGGGIGGLSAAYYAIKKNPCEKVVLIEATDRVGGWLKSTKQNDGTIFEQSARTIRPRGQSGINTLQLVDDLGLDTELLPVGSSAVNRMVYVNGRLHTLPSNIFSIFTKQTPFSKPLVAHLFKDLITPKKLVTGNDESIYDFVNRRVGSEVADYLISPMICGICGGDAKEISVKFLMESLFNMEQKYGSVARGVIADLFTVGTNQEEELKESFSYNRAMKEKWSVYSFKSGMEILPKVLRSKIEYAGVEIKLNSKVKRLEVSKENVTAHLENGKSMKGTKLISSLPARSLCVLLEQQHPTLAALLASIPSVSMCVINLKYGQRLIKDEGFGFLVAPKENLPILGVIYDSCCFPQSENTVLTVMMGGFRFNKLFTSSTKESEVIEIALQQIKNILGITKKPDFYKVTFLHDCIPQYLVGHKAKVDDMNKYIKDNKLSLSLCGASYYGVGVNDVILSGKNAAVDVKTY